MSEQASFDMNQVIGQARAVITRPAAYFQSMPRSGGYANPLIFIAVMGAATGLVSAVFSLFSVPAGTMAAGLAQIIILPIFFVIGAFIGSAFLFGIWKLMGSTESYETAFRCEAAATALYPIGALLSIVPYLGAIILITWGAFLMIEASVWVHARRRRTAQIVFGVLAAILILSNVTGEHSTRQLQTQMEEIGAPFQGMEDMTPEEAGRKMGEFLRGLEEGQKGSGDD